MVEDTGCGESDLYSLVSKCLRSIEEYLDECIEEIEFSEISEELDNLRPQLSLVLSKWVSEIIYSLFIKSMGFNEMKNLLGVSSRVLSDKLKILENSGIVLRKVIASRPVRVQYELTNVGKVVALALVPLLTIIKNTQNQIRLQ